MSPKTSPHLKVSQSSPSHLTGKSGQALLKSEVSAFYGGKKIWLEVLGIFLTTLGFFLLVACLSYTSSDYLALGLAPKVMNIAGPWGAFSSALILGRFGLVGFFWPLLIIALGLLASIGKIRLPPLKEFLQGFLLLLILTAIFASWTHIFLSLSKSLDRPSYGYGGQVGETLGGSLLRVLGPGGSLIVLFGFTLLSLVVTGNISLARAYNLTASRILDLSYFLRKFSRKNLPRLLTKFKYITLDWAISLVLGVLWVARVFLKTDHFLRLKNKIQKLKPSTVSAMPNPSSKISEHELHKARNSRRDLSSLPVGASNQGAGVDQSFKKDHQPFNGSPLPLALELYYEGGPHGRPESHLFSRTQSPVKTTRDYQTTSDELVKQLAEFRVFGEITQVTNGPLVTTFEFKPSAGTKVAKIAAVGEDLARMLRATSLRVLTPIPGKDTVGFEVPNKPEERAMIGFSDIMNSKDFHNPKRKLPIAMGVDIFGQPVIEDLAEMPHLLVAGSTGSGKSVFMNTLIGSLIAKHSARSLRLIMIDPKMVELAAYNSLPHMAHPVITDTSSEGRAILLQMVDEMERRYRSMRSVGARSIDGFNEIIKTRRKNEFMEFDGPWLPLPYMVLIIDEMADMMMTLGRDAETPIARLAQKARAAGIHMVIATQRPSADVVTGLIKANFPTRVAFRVLSGIDSRTILDQVGAETLLGKGDMLYLSSSGMRRIHGAYLSDAEVQAMVKACKRKRT